jgi:hypothetical protein
MESKRFYQGCRNPKDFAFETTRCKIFCICDSHIENLFDLCACADSNPEIIDRACVCWPCRLLCACADTHTRSKIFWVCESQIQNLLHFDAADQNPLSLIGFPVVEPRPSLSAAICFESVMSIAHWCCWLNSKWLLFRIGSSGVRY